MALSFRQELETYIKHNLEQEPMVHEAMTKGQRKTDVQEALDYVGACLRIYQDTILMIADEIDELRASSNRGEH